MEDKQVILDLLLPALQHTRALEDLVGLRYESEREAVIARFANGGEKIVNVSGDSGVSMITDLIKRIV